MSDVLSQSEIDELLKAYNMGNLEAAVKPEEPKEKVKNYDFRTANRFSKEQLRTLNIIYETFARLLETYLTGTLRTNCTIELVSVEEQKYSEFVNALPQPVMLAIVSMPPLAGSTLLEMGPNVVYTIISRLLGGVNTGGVEQGRTYTEIELVIVERVIRQLMRLLNESWEKVISVSSKLDRIETSSQFAQIVAMNDTIVIITMDVTIGQNEGLINICIPQVALEPVTNKLNTRMWFQSGGVVAKYESAAGRIKSKIQNTLLDVSVVFNDTSASVRDVLNLQVGDVIQLDHPLEDNLTIKVGHLPKFRGELGVKENKYAVKISKLIREEELEDG